MDVFEYHCTDDGIVAVIQRDFIQQTKPPRSCPFCGKELRVEIVPDFDNAA
jgi:hypothetical protein